MNKNFSYTLRSLREKKNISQSHLAVLVGVERSAIAHWESGDRVPGTKYLVRLAEVLGVDVSTLLSETPVGEELTTVIIVDDETIALQGAARVVSEVMPHAHVETFQRFSDALEYSKKNNVSLALLDVEIGRNNGLDLCDRLLAINPNTSIVFLTAYPGYALDAWSTKANGFLVKPLKPADLKKQLLTLRPTATNK